MSEFLLLNDIEQIVENISDVSNQFSGKTVLLTGGRGFLGRYFMEIFNLLNEQILKEKVKVIVLDNLITSGKEGADIPSYENIEFINHNVIEKFSTDEKIDFIIHAAGIASPYYYRAYPLETLEVAINGTKNMLELAVKNSARLSFFSSSEIYGDPDPKNIPTKESYKGNVSCTGPRACYDESKRVGETLCNIFHNLKGVCTNTIRPFNVFGPGMQETDYRVLPNFTSRIKGNIPLQIYGTGNQTRTFCYITDAMEGFIRVILNGVPGEAYNIGNPNPEISVIELIEKIELILDKKVKYNIVDYPDSYPADEPNRRCPDILKAKRQIKYQPKVEINEGLRRYIKWTDSVYTGRQ
jgi:UDP-glucuronate decarboxylase